MAKGGSVSKLSSEGMNPTPLIHEGVLPGSCSLLQSPENNLTPDPLLRGTLSVSQLSTPQQKKVGMNHIEHTGSPLVIFPKTYKKALLVHLSTTACPLYRMPQQCGWVASLSHQACEGLVPSEAQSPKIAECPSRAHT